MQLEGQVGTGITGTGITDSGNSDTGITGSGNSGPGGSAPGGRGWHRRVPGSLPAGGAPAAQAGSWGRGSLLSSPPLHPQG